MYNHYLYLTPSNNNIPRCQTTKQDHFFLAGPGPPIMSTKKGKHYWGVNFYTGGRKSFQFSPILGDILTNRLRDVNFCTKALSHTSLTDQKKYWKSFQAVCLHQHLSILRWSKINQIFDFRKLTRMRDGAIYVASLFEEKTKIDLKMEDRKAGQFLV